MSSVWSEAVKLNRNNPGQASFGLNLLSSNATDLLKEYIFFGFAHLNAGCQSAG